MCFSCKVRACGVILTAFTGYYPFPLSGRLCHIRDTVGTPFGSPIIQAVSRATKGIMGTRVCNRKEPVSPDMIRKLVEKSNLDNLLEL